MKVLHVCPNFHPATRWGGPIRSTKAICDGLAEVPWIELRVLTADAEGPGSGAPVRPVPLPYPVRFTRRLAGHAIAPGLLARLGPAVAWADVVHLTGTYNFPTLPTLALARAFGRPVVWSPRGAILAAQDWPAARRPALKRRFEGLARALAPRDLVVHATSEAEARAHMRRLPGTAQAMIPNALPLPPALPSPARPGRRLMALGRLDPKKGFDLLIEALARLPAQVTLDLYGEGAERARLEALARPLGGRVRLHGHVEGGALRAGFAAADLVVLPSHSENFGLTVAEALAHGRPVLTTTGTPWAAIEREGCGRVIDLSRDDLAAEIAALLVQDLPGMGARGRAYVGRAFRPEEMVARFVTLYADLAQGEGRVAWA